MNTNAKLNAYIQRELETTFIECTESLSLEDLGQSCRICS